MLGETVENALNEQLNVEFFSSYYYLSMAAHFLAQNLQGFGHWLRLQAREENTHALKIYDFIDNRDGKIDLKTIEAPPKTWETPLSVFEDALEHEQEVSVRINDLVDLALREKDHATNTFLQWFVSEQVEEVASVKAITDTLKLIGSDASGLFLMDRDLAERALGPEEIESTTDTNL